MKKKEKGFFDELIDDFAATAEMKAAIEASRDENGKIDVVKATAISMGLGHMSDNDIATMAGLLGAEGAFDDEDSIIDPPVGLAKVGLRDTLLGSNLVSAADMRLLIQAGYSVNELKSMNLEELREAMEEAGVDTDLYDLFENTFIGSNLVSAADMKRLSKAGYSVNELKFMNLEELREAMEKTGVDTDLYDLFENTFIGSNLVSADDMQLLSEAGYNEIDLELMEPEELKEAMEEAGVDTDLYDFDE